MPKIYIAHDRYDHIVGSLVAELKGRFGKTAVMTDVNKLGLERLREEIHSAIGDSNLLLAIVGPTTFRRGFSIWRNYFVLELEIAVECGVPLLPVLVGGGKMPLPSDFDPNLTHVQLNDPHYLLPNSLKHLPDLPAIQIDALSDFGPHMNGLIRAIEAQLGELPNTGSISSNLEAETDDAAQTDQFPRSSPEYWLHRVSIGRKLKAGDQPLVLISFAGDDQTWVEDLRDFLEAKMELLRDKGGQPYHLWNYSDAKRGTRVGDEFPEIVAEKMWRCQAAILLFSRAYFRSDYCKQIELPFLLWRRDHHNLMCLPIKIGTPSYEKVRIPNYQCESRYVVLNELVDDRQAAEKFTESQYRSWDLGRLRQEGKDWDIEQRLAGVAHHIAEFLKANCSAVEVG